VPNDLLEHGPVLGLHAKHISSSVQERERELQIVKSIACHTALASMVRSRTVQTHPSSQHIKLAFRVEKKVSD
jgi:hypothetical protein